MKRAAVISLLLLIATATAGTFTLNSRSRIRDAAGDWAVRHQKVLWEAKATAVIVCDMWDLHHCKNAVGRVGEMAPHMNKFLNTARTHGALIIHAPSSCMDFYKNHPARKRAQATPPTAVQPKDIQNWCHWIDQVEESQGYPIDHSDGGEDDDPEEHAAWAEYLTKLGRNPRSPWKRQVKLIEIDPDRDAISDSGIEIWNLLETRDIHNVLLVGVHTNMCVLGRPFGLRNLTRNGKNVLLVRDLTDAMYNPAKWPYVNHFRGTSLVVEHIEQRVCPTTTSDQLIGGEPFRFQGDTPPHVVFMIGENEYDTASTLPLFAKRQLEYRGISCTFVHVNQNDPNNFAGLEALDEADLLFLSVRRRTPPKAQLKLVRDHLAKGKPLVGIRTASHAFDREPRGKHLARWSQFDCDILGVDYLNHYGNRPPKDPATLVQATAFGTKHAIMTGIPHDAFEAKSHLYKNKPVSSNVSILMTGTLAGRDDIQEPVAWTNDAKNSRVFYTSLGSTGDFALPAFQRLLLNGVLWALEKTIPPADPRVIAGNKPNHGQRN